MAKDRKKYLNNYVHYNLGANASAQSKYESSLNSFINQVTEQKLAMRYAKRVKSVYNLKNKQDWYNTLKAANYLQNGDFSSQLNQISNSIVTNVLSSSGVKIVGAKGGRSLVNEAGQRINAMSKEAATLFNNIEKIFEQFLAVFSQQDTSAYLTLLKDIFKGDPEVMKVLNTLGSTGKHILTRNRMDILNAGMKGHFQKIKSIMGTVKSSNDTLLSYVRGQKPMTFLSEGSQGGSYDSQIASLAGYCNIAIASLGGAMFEAIAADTVDINKIMSWFRKDVISGIRPGPKGQGFYINNIKHMGANTNSNSNLNFSIGTTDLMMNLTKGKGSIRVNIPVGVSLKRSSSSTKGNIHNVKIKNSTFNTLKDITKARVLHGIWDKNVDISMANIFGNHGSTETQSGRRSYQYQNLNVLLNKINLSFLVAGLAGSLTADDLATVFIVNGDMYNIYDMIRKPTTKVITGGLNVGHIDKIRNWNKFLRVSGDKGKRKNLTQSRELAQVRSETFYSHLMEGGKNIKLALKLSMKI